MTSSEAKLPRQRDFHLARVLLVDDNPAARLTLQAVLQAGGYLVDSARSAAEAFTKMDTGQYALVMTDLHGEAPEASLEVLAHARLMEYEPATALVTSDAARAVERQDPRFESSLRSTLVEPQDLPDLLTKVADLISQRAARLVALQLRQAESL